MDETILAMAVLGNTLNIAYNIPFVYQVIKTQSADDISAYFLYLRIVGSIAWLIYSGLTQELFVGLSYTVTLTSSLIVWFIKTFRKPIKSKIEVSTSTTTLSTITETQPQFKCSVV